MDRKIIIGVVIVVIVLVGAFMFMNTTGESEEITGKVIGGEEVLYVVTSPWKPYMYEEDGEYKGIYVDIMDLAFDNLGIEYKFEIFPWPRAYAMGEEGVADGLLGASYKPEREPVVRFTPEQKVMVDIVNRGEIPPSEAYLGMITQVFFIRKIYEGKKEFESPEQIADGDYRIGINKGYGYAPVIYDSNWTLVEHITEEDSFSALESGEIDLYIASKAVGLSVLKEIDLLDEITFIEKPIALTPSFLLFTKASDYPNLDEIVKQFDEELIKIHESGEYNEIYRRYTE